MSEVEWIKNAFVVLALYVDSIQRKSRLANSLYRFPIELVHNITSVQYFYIT